MKKWKIRDDELAIKLVLVAWIVWLMVIGVCLSLVLMGKNQ